jgi:hypothetical protein
MMDEHFHRLYREGGGTLNAGIDQAIAAIGRELGKSLQALHRVEWSAPWARPMQPSAPAKKAR